MQCNICGGTQFEAYKGRKMELCTSCLSKARHRVALDVYERLLFPKIRDGQRVLHLAPEDCLYPILKERLGDGYITADASPERYPHATPKKLFLPDDFDAFPAGHFSGIIHNHVLEHIPGHWKEHIAGMVNWLEPGGLMIFSMPGPYAGNPTVEGGEHLASDAERIARFGQWDHLKIFGDDFLPFLRSLEEAELIDDGVTDERRAEIGVRPGKATFYILRKSV